MIFDFAAKVLGRRSLRRRLFDSWVNPEPKIPYHLQIPFGASIGRFLTKRKEILDAFGYPLPAGSQTWQELNDTIIADGTAVTAAAITIICPDFSIVSNYMQPGRALRIYAAGTISTVVTTPGTGVWGVSWGGVAGVVLAKSAAQVFHTTAQTLAGWNFTVIVQARVQGATGKFMNSGNLNDFNVLETTAANLKPAVMGSAGTNSNAEVTVDTTVAKALSCTFTQTVTTGSLVCQQRLIESLN